MADYPAVIVIEPRPGGRGGTVFSGGAGAHEFEVPEELFSTASARSSMAKLPVWRNAARLAGLQAAFDADLDGRTPTWLVTAAPPSRAERSEDTAHRHAEAAARTARYGEAMRIVREAGSEKVAVAVCDRAAYLREKYLLETEVSVGGPTPLLASLDMVCASLVTFALTRFVEPPAELARKLKNVQTAWFDGGRLVARSDAAASTAAVPKEGVRAPDAVGWCWSLYATGGRLRVISPAAASEASDAADPKACAGAAAAGE